MENKWNPQNSNDHSTLTAKYFSSGKNTQQWQLFQMAEGDNNENKNHS